MMCGGDDENEYDMCNRRYSRCTVVQNETFKKICSVHKLSYEKGSEEKG